MIEPIIACHEVFSLEWKKWKIYVANSLFNILTILSWYIISVNDYFVDNMFLFFILNLVFIWNLIFHKSTLYF